jgi:hypothetical protein
VATPTVANSPNPPQLFAESLRPVAPMVRPKPQPEFLVFPTGTVEYHWCIVALAANRTISRHKSLTFALRKCIRLNEQRGQTQLDPLNTLGRADRQGVGNEPN